MNKALEAAADEQRCQAQDKFELFFKTMEDPNAEEQPEVKIRTGSVYMN